MTRLIFLSLFCLLAGPPATRSQVVFQAPFEDRGNQLKFGQTTCISPDGRRVVVGANGYQNFKGALYVYELASGKGDRMNHWRRTRLCANDTESAEQKKPRELRLVGRGSGFGFSCIVTHDSKHIVVGAPGHDMQKGSVYIFTKSAGSYAWRQTAKLAFAHGKNGDSFGWDVVVNKLCTRIAISAKGRRANNGEVYIYSCKKGCKECTVTARLEPPDYTDAIGPRGIRIRNNFGASMAMNGDGSLIAIGSTGFEEERGAVYIFVKHNGASDWTLAQRIESPNAQKCGFFGFKMSMDRDGRNLAIGADGENEYKGAVYMFEQKRDFKKGIKFEMYQEIMSGEGTVEDNFGGSVAISGNGDVLMVGAPGANEGDVKDMGALYIYEKTEESVWKVGEKVLLSGEHSGAGDFYGWTVAMSGDGSRYVATAPACHEGSGVATVGMFAVTQGLENKDEV